MKTRLMRLLVATGIAAMFLAAAPQASAEIMTLQYTGSTGASQISYTLNGSVGSTTPGPYSWANNTIPGGGGAPVSTFCIELTQGIPSGNIDFTVTALSTLGTTKANAITALYGNKSGYSDSAFQLALWELIYDGNYDAGLPLPLATNLFSGSTGGTLRSTSSVAAGAQALLTATLNNISGGIANFNTNYAGYSLVALTSNYSQDQIYLKPNPKPVGAIPAPPAIVLAGLGLLALGGRSRWNRRTPAAA